MTNESELALSIRARILPRIEGSNEFFSQLEQTPQRITAPMQQLSQDPTFQQEMSPKGMRRVNAFANNFEDIEDYEKKIRDLRNEIATTIKASEQSGHKLTTYDLFSMNKKMLQEQAELEDFQKKQMKAIDEMDLSKEKRRELRKLTKYKNRQFLEIDRGDFPKEKKESMKQSVNEQYEEQRLALMEEIKFLDTGKKDFMKEALVIGIKDASAGLDELNPKLKEMVGHMKEGGEAGEGIYTMLQQGGYLALMGQATQTAMNWMLSESRIEAKQLTSFNLTSPMGSYAATEEAKLFKETTERSREYELTGNIVGAIVPIVAGLLAPVTAGASIPIAAMAAGGAIFGGMMGGKFAESENIEDRAKLETDIKYRTQALGKAEQLVQSARGYEIDKYKSELRFGKEMGGSEMGYSPDEYLALQKGFGGELGRLDENLLKEQLAYTRPKGIDPRELFQFGNFERQTGTELDFGYLTNVQGKTKELYGPDADNQKIIDVLKDIRETAMKQLKAGVDTHDAIKFAVDLPRMVMGEASPYGRAGDLGGITTSAFERFFKPQDLAEKTLLYSALGGKGLFEDKSYWETGADQTHPKGYLMREGQGMFGENNFGDVMTKLKDWVGGDEKALQGILDKYLKDYPKEIKDKMGTLLMGNEVELPIYKRDKKGEIAKDEEGNPIVEKTEKYSLEDVIKGNAEAVKDFTKDIKEAGQYVSVWEKKQAEIREIDLRAAEKAEKTIDNSAVKQSLFWENMLGNVKVQKDMIETVQKGIDAQYARMITMGIEDNPVYIKKFLEEKKEEAYERAGIKEPDKLSIEKRREILKEQGYKALEQEIIDADMFPDEMKGDGLSDAERKKIKRDADPMGIVGPDRSSLYDPFFEKDMKIPEAYRNEPQRQTSETNKELIARVEGLETLNRTIDTLIFKFDSLGDKIELASLRQGNIKVKVEGNDDEVYSQQSNFLDSRA